MTGKRGKVLLADDTRFFRTALSELLEGEGWNVVQAEDGRTALEAALRELSSLDLLILDVEMPGLDGIEVLRSLRQQKASPRVPALILSGTGVAAGEEEQLRGLGVTETLEKSVPLPELARRIVQAAGRDRKN